jgi:hypothetical protein
MKWSSAPWVRPSSSDFWFGTKLSEHVVPD